MITSSRNPKIQRLRQLLGKSRQRKQAGVFVVEGVRLVEEALAAGLKPELVLYSEALSERGLQAVRRFAEAGVETEPVAEGVLKGLSDTETPQGVFTFLPIQPLPIPPRLDFALVLDAVHDPGNLGTLLRTAAATGVQAVFLMPGCADPYAPKVVRSAMGAHFRLPLLEMDWGELETQARRQALRFYLAEAAAGEDLWQADLRLPLALVVGSEAEGASPPARRMADAYLRIPMPGRFESLNAAVAGAILMFEVVRQRNLGSGHQAIRT